MKLAVALVILILFCYLDVRYGSVSLFWHDLLAGDEVTKRIVEVRFVETLQALLAGAVLALCGGVLQKILKNPLADPFILGISSGGSCFSALFVLLHVSSAVTLVKMEKYFPMQSVVSLIGCLIAFSIITYFKRRIKSYHAEYSYLIIGIILNSFFSATLMLAVSFADQAQLSQIHNWLIGCLQPISFFQLLSLFFVCVPFVLMVLNRTYALNYLIFGDEFAKSLGVNPDKTRNKLIFFICILISVVVSVSGAIGFIGLIVPHIARKLYPVQHQGQYYFIMILGAIILVFSDFLSRVLLSPTQLPIGIFTAFLGTPALAIILLRRTKV